jgi:hypothetical protein
MTGHDWLATGTSRARAQRDDNKRGIAFVLDLSQRHVGDPSPAFVPIRRVFLDSGDNGQQADRAGVHRDHVRAQFGGFGDRKAAIG